MNPKCHVRNVYKYKEINMFKMDVHFLFIIISCIMPKLMNWKARYGHTEALASIIDLS